MIDRETDYFLHGAAEQSISLSLSKSALSAYNDLATTMLPRSLRPIKARTWEIGNSTPSLCPFLLPTGTRLP